jgi:hypothetical protein
MAGKKNWIKKGHLTARARESMPKSDFALPGKGEGPKGAGSGSYPIPDKSHARNALARSSGKPVAAAVRAKVHAKFPDIGKDKGKDRRKKMYDHPRSHPDD